MASGLGQADHARLDNPALRTFAGVAPLLLFLAIAAWLGTVGGPGFSLTIVNFLIAVTAVVGLGIFAGNSGILSFMHPAFMAIGAYASGLLTVSPALKHMLLPQLPALVADAHLAPAVALAVATLACGLFALVVGAPIARLSGAGAGIYTLGWLIIIGVTLNGATEITRGAQTFFGVPRYVTVWIAFVAAAAAVVVARAFRESRTGLELRSSREDELAARSMGVNVYRARLIAFVLSAMVLAVAGVLLGHSLGAFSPKEFSFSLAFIYLAMLIVGGAQSTLGAVTGAAVVTCLVELARHFEEGVHIGPVSVPPVLGITQMIVGVALLLILYRRPEGLFPQAEPEELSGRFSRWRRGDG